MLRWFSRGLFFLTNAHDVAKNRGIKLNEIEPLKRSDPIDEHEMKIIVDALDAACQILEKIPFRTFSITIREN
jgi:hypothetical protein